MTPTGDASPPCERPAFFAAGNETLFGILTTPPTLTDPTAVLILSGGLTGTSTVGRNRMFVRLARRVAADGRRAMRFDYHGIGESTGVIEEFRLDAGQPFITDITSAVAWLAEQGITRVVLVGKCFGSRMALSACHLIDGLAGLVLIGPPVRDFGAGERTVSRLANELSVGGFARRAMRLQNLRGLSDPRRRRTYALAAKAKLKAVRQRASRRPGDGAQPDLHGATDTFIDPLKELVRRQVPVQFVYGSEDDFFADFEKARQGPLGEVLTRAGPGVELTVLPGQVRGFAEGGSQDLIIDVIAEWITQLGSPAPQAGAIRP